MNSEVFDLAAFDSTHTAIKAERELTLAEINIKIIPVPREITADCGISIKIKTGDFNLVRKVLAEKHIGVSGYYYIKKSGLKIVSVQRIDMREEQ